MAEIQTLKAHYEIVKRTIQGFSAAQQKITKQCESLAEKIMNIESKMQISENEVELNALFNESKLCREELLKKLTIKKKLEVVIERNKTRQKSITDEIGDDIENPASKKEVEGILKEYNFETDIMSLGLSNSGTKLLSFCGYLIEVNDGKINLEDGNNFAVISSLDFDKLIILMMKYPDFVSTVTDEMLLNNGFRTLILKVIACYAFENLKKKTMSEINHELGDLLVFKKEITKDYRDYVSGVSNFFKVRIKRYLIERNADLEEEISSKLICNESSKLLPDEYYVEKIGGDTADESNSEIDIDAEIEAFLKSLSEE